MAAPHRPGALPRDRHLPESTMLHTPLREPFSRATRARSSGRPLGRLGGFLLAASLPFLSCSSVDRTPATGSVPPDVSMEPAPAAPARSDAAAAPAEGGLTDAEIRALPPEDEVSVEVLDLAAMTLDELNASGAVSDIHFDYDSAELSAEARRILEVNAAWLARYPSVRVLVEGHCDERGTVEYNLALGEERARAARDYLRDLGIPDTRMRIISYGKEFPLDPRSNEEAWRQNRRAHLEIIAK